MALAVRRAGPQDLEQIKALCDKYISQDFYSPEDLENMCRGEDDLLFVAVDTQRQERVAAFFYAFLATLDRALEILHLGERPEPLRDVAGDTRVGVFKTSSTDPAYRGRGVFTAFMNDLQGELRARGAVMIINTALRPLGRDVPITRILRDTGFVPDKVLHRPWQNVKGYCPYCKQDYCICDAVFYYKRFS